MYQKNQAKSSIKFPIKQAINPFKNNLRENMERSVQINFQYKNKSS